MNFVFFILAFILVLAVSISMVLISYLFGPSLKTEIKKQVFECGMEQAMPVKKCVNINFYVIAVIFLAFDIEIVFLYPWVWGFSSLSDCGFFAGLILIGIILFTTFYIIRRKALEWD
ncbi:MAG: NADH-quinone oxidoreductase subunit A [Elusimicrobiales bacterium]